MKLKKFSLAIILLAITVITYIVASVLFCYTTKPKVLTGEFPFSITYEYKGETHTLSGVLACEYSGSNTIYGKHNRYWNQETIYHNPDNVENPFIIEQNDELQTTLAVQEHMCAGYFMGDPLYENYYTEYGYEGPVPDVEYYDYKNDITLNDENKEEVLESIGFKIIDFTYAEPIENSFSFSGVRYEGDNILIFFAIMLLFFLLCLIFVRRDKEYTYVTLDKVGIALNFLVAFVADDASPLFGIFVRLSHHNCYFFSPARTQFENSLIDFHGRLRREIVAAEHHDRADTELLAEVGGDFGRLLLGNTRYLRKPVGTGFKHIKGILAERFHDQLCGLRTNALDGFGGEVFENRGRGRRQLLFKVFDLELPSE